MPHYTVTAHVTVDVGVDIEASTPEEARKIFDENIALNATLVDVDKDKFIAHEDSISDIDNIEVEQC